MPDLILPGGIPKDLVRQLEAMAPFPDRCVQTFFRIKNKTGQMVDFRYNRPQNLHAERSTDFDMVLKPRKVGISSRRICRDLWICATRKNQHRILLAQTDPETDKMMAERIKPAIDNCKFPLGAVQRQDYIHFPLTSSRYYVGTAGSKKFGRGSDITGKHFMEYAHWESPDVATAVDEALVDGADGLIETTANGHNFFKSDWDRAKRGDGKDRAIFLPWYSAEEYVRPWESEPGPLSEDERRLMDAFGLSREQIAWRRWKRRTMRDPALFPQEYPETDEQAFLSTGRPVFDWISLERCRGLVSKPKWRGYLVRRHDRIVLVDDPLGPLSVWRIPERGHLYAIGSDVAEGLEDGAFSTGEVLDLGDSEQVAEWHGHIAPDLLAEVLELLSDWYNQAVIVPEAWPGPGEVTTSHLVQRHAKVWTSPEGQMGFQTNMATKPAMVSAFVAALRDHELAIRSPELLQECHAFTYDAKMRMGPSLGNFSDRVMGMGIVWYCTRDLAERVDYYKPSRPPFVKQSSGGSTSVPRWQGPRPGRREE